MSRLLIRGGRVVDPSQGLDGACDLLLEDGAVARLEERIDPAVVEGAEVRSTDELAAAIRRVADGDAVFSPRLAGFVLDAFAARPDVPVADPELDQLTNREREVLRLLARGYAYKEIAKELFISIKTVETHVSNVLRKLQMSNRYELSRWAADRRLV